MFLHAAPLARLAALCCEYAAIALGGTWGALALFFQIPRGKYRNSFIAFCIAWHLGLLALILQGRVVGALAGFGVGMCLLLSWWRNIRPTNDAVWAEDVARITTATVEGTEVTVHNVRNFDWRSETEYTAKWETRSYQLDQLISTDMIMSYWEGPAIAHMLISFGFASGDYIAFSVEVRRSKGKTYSELGGFFKAFGLSIIAADERDVVRLRTNVRGEDVYLYALRLPRAAMRSLFLGYLQEANQLPETPRFYNTVTVNCTMLVYHMMRRIVGHLPFSYRVLFSGYLPQYVYRVGGLDHRYALAELTRLGRVKERALAADQSSTFSKDIRRGVPRPAID